MTPNQAKTQFQPGNTGNPNGRPKGSSFTAIKIKRALAPYMNELAERGVEAALSGDKSALCAVLNLYASANVASLMELRAKGGAKTAPLPEMTDRQLDAGAGA